MFTRNEYRRMPGHAETDDVLFCYCSDDKNAEFFSLSSINDNNGISEINGKFEGLDMSVVGVLTLA